MMADAMTRMMDAMGMFDSASTQSMDPLSMDPFGASGWEPGLGMPWGSSFQDPTRAFAMGEMMKQFARGMPGPGAPGGARNLWSAPWTASRLEGVWEGRGGELLIIQGNRFRIYSPGMQRVDGLIQIRDDRLALYNTRDEHAQPFEFAESRGRLILRDHSGQAYLYRRLRLDGGHAGADARKRPKR